MFISTWQFVGTDSLLPLLHGRGTAGVWTSAFGSQCPNTPKLLDGVFEVRGGLSIGRLLVIVRTSCCRLRLSVIRLTVSVHTDSVSSAASP